MLKFDEVHAILLCTYLSFFARISTSFLSRDVLFPTSAGLSLGKPITTLATHTVNCLVGSRESPKTWSNRTHRCGT